MSPWYRNLPLWVTLVPLLGALLLLWVPKSKRRVFELGALAVTMFDFLLSLPLWAQYDRTSPAVQWVTSLDWIPSLGVKFSIGTNNSDSKLGREEYALQMIRQCDLKPADMFLPKPDGKKPIQVRGFKAKSKQEDSTEK